MLKKIFGKREGFLISNGGFFEQIQKNQSTVDIWGMKDEHEKIIR